MAGPKDQPTEEISSSSKQQSPQGNNFSIEKSDGGDNVVGADEGQNKTDVALTIVVAAGGGGGGSPPSAVNSGTRKRGRVDSDGEADAGALLDGSKDLKKGGLKRTCYVCKKGFGTWRALFGHMKVHPRLFPGSFPPPSFTPPKGSPKNNNLDVNALKEQLAPTLLNLAYETMHKLSQDEFNASVVAGDALSQDEFDTSVAAVYAVLPCIGGGRGLGIDLNEPRTSFLLDLNKSPPPENGDDDGEKEDAKANADADGGKDKE